MVSQPRHHRDDPRHPQATRAIMAGGPGGARQGATGGHRPPAGTEDDGSSVGGWRFGVRSSGTGTTSNLEPRTSNPAKEARMRLYLLLYGTNSANGTPFPGYLIQTDDGTNVLIDTG